MPDIDMCQSVTCPIKDGCYRHRAIPNSPYQWYNDFSNQIQATRNGFECEMYIPLYITVATDNTAPIPEPEGM